MFHSLNSIESTGQKNGSAALNEREHLFHFGECVPVDPRHEILAAPLRDDAEDAIIRRTITASATVMDTRTTGLGTTATTGGATPTRDQSG